MTAGSSIRLEGLSAAFDLPDGRRVEALRRIDLDLPTGSFTCILGPTGCGKTTLLRVVAGLQEASEGAVRIAGSRTGRPVIGFVFQQHALFPWMSVLSNAEFGLRAAGIGRVERRRRAVELLGAVGLAGFEHAWPHQLSGGMQQRASLVRSIAIDPEVLLLDEPFGALDTRTRFELEDVVLDIWRRFETTMLFVTHSIEEAVYLADRVVVLGHRPGMVVYDRDVTIERPRDRLSQAFVETMLDLRRVFEGLVKEEAPEEAPPAP